MVQKLSSREEFLFERRVAFYFIITVLLSAVQGLILFCFLFKYSQTLPTSLENRIDIRGLDIASSLRSLRISSWNVLNFFSKNTEVIGSRKSGFVFLKQENFRPFDRLLPFYTPLEDEDKSFYCFVVIILDYSESFVNMVFGNFLGFLKEDVFDGCWRDC